MDGNQQKAGQAPPGQGSRAASLRLAEIARRAALPVAAGGTGGIAWVALAHDGSIAALIAVFVAGVTAGFPKAVKAVYKHLPDIVREKGAARATVIDAEARRARAKVAEINAQSRARNSAVRTDAEARASARRTEVEARLLQNGMASGKVNDAVTLVNLLRDTAPETGERTEPPAGEAATVHPIRRQPTD
jgi:hypothetical protein